mgnify:CR=1 FL=1
MKKIFLLLLALISLSLFAANRRVYINPGHGSWCANCRPMATIPYPKLSSTGMPDTLGFYESNTNLWKGLYLRDKLQAAGGYTVLMSRTANGPAGSTSTANNKYNRSLSEICEEVEAKVREGIKNLISARNPISRREAAVPVQVEPVSKAAARAKIDIAVDDE